MDYSKLHWCSDCYGEDIGNNEIEVVGLYILKDFPNIRMYIDIDREEIIKVWLENDAYNILENT